MATNPPVNSVVSTSKITTSSWAEDESGVTVLCLVKKLLELFRDERRTLDPCPDCRLWITDKCLSWSDRADFESNPSSYYVLRYGTSYRNVFSFVDKNNGQAYVDRDGDVTLHFAVTVSRCVFPYILSLVRSHTS